MVLASPWAIPPMSRDDVANGRLVVPFNVSMPSAGYYFVTPQDRPVASKLNLFREWLRTAAK